MLSGPCRESDCKEQGCEFHLKKAIEEQLANFKNEMGREDPSVTIELAPSDSDLVPLESHCAGRALNMLLALPHGVLAMSNELQGLVESSSNLANVRTTLSEITVLTSSRSSKESSVKDILLQISAIAELCGAKIKRDEGYPGWQPDMESPLIGIAYDVYREKFGISPEFTAIHAGLECGIIKSKYPDMDIISLGPTIQNPHSPNERVSVSSVEKCYEFLKLYLKKLTLYKR
jgi:dipeptidase D